MKDTTQNEDGVSVWAPSEHGEDFNATREDAIVRLMDRVEALETRLELGLGVSCSSASSV